MTTSTPSVPPPADTPAPSVEAMEKVYARGASSNAHDHHMVPTGETNGGFSSWRLRTNDEWCDRYEVLQSQLAQSERELADSRKSCDIQWAANKKLVEERDDSREAREYEVNENEKLKGQLATAQRDTATRAGMAEELAGAFIEFCTYIERHALELQTHASATEAQKTIQFQEAYRLYEKYDVEFKRPASLLARYAALPKGRL